MWLLENVNITLAACILFPLGSTNLGWVREDDMLPFLTKNLFFNMLNYQLYFFRESTHIFT